MENSVWNLLKYEDKDSVQPMLEYIAKRADELETMTDKNVKAVFCPKRQNQFERAVHRVGQITQNDTVKHNAANFFDGTNYEFYITDSSGDYEMAIFNLKCKDFFPADLDIDEEVAYEANCGEKISLMNFEQFKELFPKLLNTEKVKYVIYKLDSMMKLQASA